MAHSQETGVEVHANVLKKIYHLRSLHIFDEGDEWRVFGFRANAKGFNASVESGRGPSIHEALDDLDKRLKEGPIHK